MMMFRKNSAAYLHELMRLDGAVQQFTTALESETMIVLEGHKVLFPKGQAVNMVMQTANRDPSAFAEPDVFDPDRENIGEMLTWNGKLKHVMARNYSGAPRFCPGYHLSMKVATEVCAQMTKELNQWGGFRQEHKKIEGLVKIKCLGLRPFVDSKCLGLRATLASKLPWLTSTSGRISIVSPRSTTTKRTSAASVMVTLGQDGCDCSSGRS